MKQAIILAGGKGTRLQERLKGLPKPLIDICGKPLLERQIENLKYYGFNQVLVLVNHGAEQIINFCHSKENWNIDIQCLDDGQPLGTAGATLQIFPKLADNFLVVYGDTMFDIDLDHFQKFHEENKEAGATLFLHPNDHPQDSDLVAINDQLEITGFYPYPHCSDFYLPNLVNAGLYYFRKVALQGWQESKAALDFGKDLFPAFIDQKILLRAYNSPEYIKDCGTPQRLDKVCAHYESGLIAQSNLRFKQKLIFLDRDGTLNKLVDQLSKAEDFEFLDGVPQAITKINKSGYRAVVVTNQPALARGECTPDELENIHRKMQTLLGEYGAYLDRIYYCPHHPDSGFTGEVVELKTVCDCRKPGIGMFEWARKELNANLEASWMIGDSSSDILAAQTAGMRSILLETGLAGLDEKYVVLPNHIAPNLSAAVDYILNDYPRLLEQCEQLAVNIHEGDLVFIGGLSRSGKSTLAHCLQDALRLKQLSAQIISVDGWLKEPSERGLNVLERYDVDALNALIKTIANRESEINISIPIYSKRDLIPKGSIQCVIGAKDVVIIEGVIALSLLSPFLPHATVHSHYWYVDIDEQARKERVIAQYCLRGKTMIEAQKIYEDRQNNEAVFIFPQKATASQCINLQLDSKNL